MSYLEDLRTKVQSAEPSELNEDWKTQVDTLISITEHMRDSLLLITQEGIMTYDPNATPEFSQANYVRMPNDDWEMIVESAQASLDEVE